MDWQDEYERKKITVNQVFEQHLTGNQKIYTGGLHVPTTIINALISRVAEGALTGIDLYGNWMNGDITFAGLDVTPEQFRYHTYFAGPNERTGFANGSKCVAHIPVHFSDTNRMLEEVGLDYAVVQMTPPDTQGNCNIGPLGFEQGALRGAKHIIAQINPHLPRVFGDSHNYHVSAIDAFVLQEEQLEDVQVPAPTPEETKVAEFIVDRVWAALPRCSRMPLSSCSKRASSTTHERTSCQAFQLLVIRPARSVCTTSSTKTPACTIPPTKWYATPPSSLGTTTWFQ